jgi:spore coat protein U-like protein
MKNVLVVILLCIPLSAQAVCTLLTTNVIFGTYNYSNFAPLDATGNVAVSCGGVAGQAITYTLSISSGSSGSFVARKMISGRYAMNYNFYLNAMHNTVWGDGNVGTGIVTDSYASVAGMNTRNYLIYGRIPGGQAVPPGVYSDALVVTVTY